MERYSDLNHEELIALTEEQIERFIEIEIAHRGIMPVPKPEEVTLEDINIKKTEVAFVVKESGYSNEFLIFKNREDAETLLRMKIFVSDHDYNTGSEYKTLKPKRDLTVEERKFYKIEDIVRVKDALANNKAKNSEFKSQRAEYDNYLKETTKIRNNVWSATYEAKEKERTFELARKTYAKHLDLAENNEDIAARFFFDAYRQYQEIAEKILGEDKFNILMNEDDEKETSNERTDCD